MDKSIKNQNSIKNSNKLNILNEQYKLYVEMADRISQRRQSANSFFLTINTALVGLVSYIHVGRPELGFHWVIGLAGVILCFTWHRLVRSYKDLNTGKFKVIHEIEKKLPIQPYSDEWKMLGEGKAKTKYLPVTIGELIVPIIFAAIHAFVIGYSIVVHLN